jgi:hypothetical protein
MKAGRVHQTLRVTPAVECLEFGGIGGIIRNQDHREGDVKHVALGSLAALIAAIITVSIHVWGAHDIQGFLAAVAGYPGLLANGDYTRLNEVLFTVVNWLFYFVVFEAVIALKKQFSK